MSEKIDMEFARRDDCIERMVPSDLRLLISERDKAEAEAQALRKEVAAAQKNLAFTEQWFEVRHERLWHWAHEELSEEQKRRYFNIVANGTAEHNEPPIYAQQICRMKHRAESAEQELAALRARVVVVPERLTNGDSISRMLREIGCDGDVSYHHAREIWNACLDELARLNGKTVSEGLLRRISDLFPADMGDDGSGRAGWFPHVRETVAELRALLSEQEGVTP
ncbi:hypothetical protein LDP20_02775 [Pseudomonas aeruginosa]|uniref:hypothetical protein n=1 Tax=Pseudomonas aeruginosa TaxID=287 RepID=UPI001EEDC474|nr:hypothetical protein [Pseudomonas aeruginosa]MCG6990774.1 hypothetical protein [Pseudomonas aeruginosa]